MKTLYLLDGSGFIFRAYHALPPLTAPDKTPVGAVYGFCNMLQKMIKKAENDHIGVIFDAGSKTFRNDIYPDYKAHRPPPPEDLIPQFSLIREACSAYAVPSFESAGFEADDLIATYAKKARDEGYNVIIVSSDKDLMQLVQDGISMYDPMKNKDIGPEQVMEKFGVGPEYVGDVLALAGDSADNVPGVPGVGVKTAAELINTFGSLDGLYENVETIKQPKRREKLIDNKDKAYISRELVALHMDTPLPLEIDDLKPGTPNMETHVEFLHKMGFQTLIKRLYPDAPMPEVKPTSNAAAVQNEESNHAPIKTDHYECIQNIDHLHEFCAHLEKSLEFAVDTETTSLSIRDAKLVGISFATRERAAYIPIGHEGFDKQIPLDTVLTMVRPLLSNPGFLKIGQNLKYDLGVLKKYDVDITPYDDTMLLSYVLNGSLHRHNMDALSQKYLNHTPIPYKDIVGTGKKQLRFNQVSIEDATKYAAEDADITFKLWQIFKSKIAHEKLTTLYERVDRPIPTVVSAMEHEGILIDPKRLDDLGQDFSTRMEDLKTQIFEEVGHDFNLASPKQMGEVLFEELKLPAPKRTKTGAYVTDADVLEKLAAQGHPIVERILGWRALQKLQSTYIEGLKSCVNGETGRIHTSYSLTATSTGRFSSSDPNLQNIPVRSEDGKKIRSAFIAKSGHKLISLDYSQIELRLLAHFANVDTLMSAFKSKKDIHTLTASDIFGVGENDVTSDMRRKAKAINFGIIYGISAFGLAQQINVSNGEAADIIKNYFARYPGIEDYMVRYKQFAKDHGYVETLWGRRCYTPGIHDRNAMMRQFAERQAINAPLQGTNADMMKKAMTAIHAMLATDEFQTKMLLQVHDELVFEAPENEIDAASQKIKTIMESIIHLDVPLVVDMAVGDNWGEL